MTVRQAYEYLLIEKRKVKAPSFHLEEFNYILNKSIQEYSNLRYNMFAANQQLSDDLAVLSVDTKAVITGSTVSFNGGAPVPISSGTKYGSDYIKLPLPANYWHSLGVHVTSKNTKTIGCAQSGTTVNRVSKRLTANTANGIINNAYLSPGYNRPYHSFIDGTSINGSDLMVFIGSTSLGVVESVTIDYLKSPKKEELTIIQRDLPNDTSDILEFPDYVCAEIIKVGMKLLLENFSDPRLSTFTPVNTSIN